MDVLRIEGGRPLRGSIPISGAKNAALPLMTASLLSEDPIRFSSIPRLADIQTLTHLLESLGVTVTLDDQAQSPVMTLCAQSLTNTVAHYDLVRKMRASILVLGPLLARKHEATVSLPGGCAIGARPVDLHLMGLEKMGAQIELKEGYIHAKAPGGLRGADIAFPLVSVTGTENLMMAATLAKGTTRLLNAACEPEVVDLADCLIKMGADIQGAGTSVITIQGKSKLSGCFHHILPDRIEAGTFMMAAAATGGDVTLTHARMDCLDSVVAVLRDAGVIITQTPEGIRVQGPHTPLKPVHVTTEPFPGYPTDLQAQLMALMLRAEGNSTLTETIFENRYMHVPELIRMGADIRLDGRTAFIQGGLPLRGAPVMATDLRASVSLVIAALMAEGTTWIRRIYHLDRGYERIEEKLRACGARIDRLPDDEAETDPQSLRA
jgi:UDP-N-acetylglucosamine 1-carboxyvinyltransferase